MRIGMIGLGTVGRGVAQILQHGPVAGQATLAAVLVRDVAKAQASGMVEGITVTNDPDAFFDGSYDLVVEVAGGVDLAKQYVERALEGGAHVVTANKALLAAHGPELFALAQSKDLSVAFEASCGGGIPCVLALTQGLAANQITGLYGILNGTCNYILTRMTSQGMAYADALQEAQDKGYAEADPTLDVSGQDAGQKLAVLASLAFGVEARGGQVRCDGIDTLSPLDIAAGQEMGYDLKLLAIAERAADNSSISLTVQPCFLSRHALLAQVGGAFNALSVVGDAVGHVMLYGQGAGQMPTASAVVADIVGVANGSYPAAFRAIMASVGEQGPADVLPSVSVVSRYYLRVDAVDRPGTLGRLATALGERGIGISAVTQHEPAGDDYVPVEFITQAAPRGDVDAAVEQMVDSQAVRGEPTVIRIVDLP